MRNASRIGKLALPSIATGKTTACRLDKGHTACLEQRNVLLYDGIFVHVGIHCRSNDHRCLGGHKGCRYHVICNTMSRLTDDVCSRGSDDKYISALGKRNMFDLPSKGTVEHIGHNAVLRQHLKRQRGDKVSGGFGHDDIDLRAQLAQTGGQISCLVGCDSAGNAKDDIFSL